jgi:hypothetical protein
MTSIKAGGSAKSEDCTGKSDGLAELYRTRSVRNRPVCQASWYESCQRVGVYAKSDYSAEVVTESRSADEGSARLFGRLKGSGRLDPSSTPLSSSSPP